MFEDEDTVYCALCGCPTNNSSADDFVGCLSNPEFDHEPTTDWLWRVKLITQHRKSRRTFIVPRAEQENANEFHVDFEENARIVRQDVDMMTVYDVEGEDPLVFPMHQDCYELLGKVVKPRKIDNSALYEFFTSHLPSPLGGSPYALKFDYGLANARPRRRWSDPGRYHTVMSPVGIHEGQATDITGSALRGAHKSNVQDIGPPRDAPTGPAADRGRHPNAPIGPYQNHRTGPYHNQRAQHGTHQMAPPANHHQGPQRNQRNRPKQNGPWGKYALPKDISDEEWEKKFSTEFAWTLEFLPSKKEIERREVDRFLFCKAIHDLGRGRGFEGFTSRVYRNALRALHNRRRLWNVCSRIIQGYQRFSKQGSASKAKPNPKQETNSSPEVSEITATSKGPTSTSHVTSSPSATLTSASIRATSTAVASTSASTASTSTSAISVSVSAASTSTTVASASTSSASTLSSKVSKPTLKASTSVPKSTPTVTDFFRRPIKGSKPWPCEPHELRNMSPIEASSMETLTLASRNSDLHNAVSFGMDANMQRFEIHFEDNGRKRSHCIGPRSTAMQYLYFDKSSELPDKITGCYVTMEQNVPVGLRFSSRSQTITAGKPGEGETAYPSQTNGGGWMTGIFCQWSDRDSPNAQLASFGVYYADD